MVVSQTYGLACETNTHTVCALGGIHYVSSVLEESHSGLARRTGLTLPVVKGLVVEVSRAVLSSSSPSPSTTLELYLSGQAQPNWGRNLDLLFHCA